MKAPDRSRVIELCLGLALVVLVAATFASVTLGSNGRVQSAKVSDAGLIAFALNWTPNTIGGHTSVICGVDLRGNAYRLTDVTQGAEEEQPSWSPGGGRFAVVNGPVTGPDAPNFAIWALGKLERVVAVGARNSEWPSWAPHGDAIAYQTPADSMAGGGLTPGIWVAHADGTGAHSVAPGRGRASWAPDGSAFALPSDNGIKIVSADGTVKQTRLQGSYVPWVSWSPGGSTLLFQQGLNNEAAIQLMALDGSHRRTIRPRVTGFTPVWSPSGRMIAYQTDDAIRVVNADGRRPRRLFGGTFIAGGGLSWQPVPQPALLKKLPPCISR